MALIDRDLLSLGDVPSCRDLEGCEVPFSAWVLLGSIGSAYMKIGTGPSVVWRDMMTSWFDAAIRRCLVETVLRLWLDMGYRRFL